MACHCGNDAKPEDCCLPILRGERKPDTAEQLMRARYSAYVTGAIDFVLATHDPSVTGEVDRKSTEEWSKGSTWKGLEVVQTQAGGPGDDEGMVEFIARFQFKGAEAAHHERARFKRVDGAWMYHDGEMVKQKTIVREGPKVGRNDPCPCGSGMKYKRCHGAN